VYVCKGNTLQDVQTLATLPKDSPRLLLQGHFTATDSITEKQYECVVKCAFKRRGDAPNIELLRLLKQEQEVYVFLQTEVKGTTGKTGCVQYLDFSEARGYLVIEEHGMDLAAVLRAPEVKSADIAKATAQAVSTLHGLGYMHGDIKPKNILILFDKLSGVCHAKLCDLDVAQPFKHECEPRVLGSTNYIPPEVYFAITEGATVRAAPEVDMFALGLVLWQIVTHGVTPALEGADLELCYTDQAALWHRLPVEGFFQEAVRSLTQLHPEERAFAQQLVNSFSGYTPSNMHQELQREKVHAEHLREQADRQSGEMQDGIMKLLAGQAQLTQAVQSLVRSNAELTSMVNTLLVVSATCPTLAIIVRDTGWKTADPFAQHFRLYFLDSHTHAIAPCGPKGKGYKISDARGWVKKMAPVINVSLVLLKLALLASGLPIPVPQLAHFLGDNLFDVNFIKDMQNFARSDSASDAVKDLEEKVKRIELGAAVLAGQSAMWVEGETREAYDTIKTVLRRYGDVSQTCGLQYVRHAGHSAWILKGEKARADWVASLAPSAGQDGK
jgi:hypothetical protein